MIKPGSIKSCTSFFHGDYGGFIFLILTDIFKGCSSSSEWAPWWLLESSWWYQGIFIGEDWGWGYRKFS